MIPFLSQEIFSKTTLLFHNISRTKIQDLFITLNIYIQNGTEIKVILLPLQVLLHMIINGSMAEIFFLILVQLLILSLITTYRAQMSNSQF